MTNGQKKILELTDALDTYIPIPVRDVTKPFLMPVEDIFSIEGRGTVVTGKIERGIVKVGEEVEIVGIKPTQKSTVTGIEMFNKNLQEGMAGDNAGVLLRGLKKEDITRGQVLAKPGTVTPHDNFTCEIYVLKKKKADAILHFSKVTNLNFIFVLRMLRGMLLLRKEQKWLCLEIQSKLRLN